MRIELRESGGIANLDSAIVVEGDQLERIDKGTVRSESHLQPEHVAEVTSLVHELEREQPRPLYGGSGASPVSDGMQSELSYSTDSSAHTIRVLTDPSDSPPEQFRALRRLLHSLARSA